MCQWCYIDAGSPKPTERSSKAVPLIEAVYDENCAGGNLHIQLDDYNLEDNFFEEETIKASSKEYPVTNAEQACYQYMRTLTEDERYAAVAEFDGYTEGTT